MVIKGIHSYSTYPKQYKMKKLYIILFLLNFGRIDLTAQPSKHVILISIDGLRPEMYLDSTWPAPNLRRLMKTGTYANYLKSVFPAYTYPSHTAMVTGALPARSGIAYNQPRGVASEFYFQTSYIRVPTLWQMIHEAGLTSAAVMWPGSVGAMANYNVPEIFTLSNIDDRIGESRKHATPAGLVEEIEHNATGKLDSVNMNGNCFSFDANTGRMAAYIFRTYRPSFMALHIALVDDEEHDFGRDGDSVRLAVEADDRVIGDLLETIAVSGLKDSTSVIIVGDHGFCDIHEAVRPNMLIRDLPARFVAAGESAFLYPTGQPTAAEVNKINAIVLRKMDSLPENKRKMFRILDREQLDRMGADSAAILALAANPGLVFSASMGPKPVANQGPGTAIQQNPQVGIFVPVNGGHHGYDPNIPDMHTGFITAGAGIRKSGKVEGLCVTDVAPLVAALLGLSASFPDGKLVPGLLVGRGN
jgi:hypothetical protein